MRLLPKARYHPFESEAQAAAAVVQGAIDAFVYDHPYHATFVDRSFPVHARLQDITDLATSPCFTRTRRSRSYPPPATRWQD